MAKKQKNNPTGFEDILDNIYSNVEGQEGVTDMDNMMVENPIEDEKEKKAEPAANESAEDSTKTDDPKVTFTTSNDDIEIPEEANKPIKTTEEETKEEQEDVTEETEDVTDAEVIEAQQVSALFDAVGESLGWNMADIDENDRPLTVEQLTNYLGEVVKQNSVPTYADERIQQLDEYVRNGGKFEDFYAKQQEALTINDLDMEDENNQKAVVRELLKYNGYTDEQINNKINRYVDADVLVEESEDALERLKAIRKKEVEEATRQQEEYARAQEQQSRQFFDTVTKDINALTNIRGIQIPREDRKALFDYIFKVDQNGVSQYQKDFNNNLSKNLIESAYFTMKADTLIQSAEKKGESSAAEKLRKLLRHTSKNHTTYNVEEKQKSVLDLASGLF